MLVLFSSKQLIMFMFSINNDKILMSNEYIATIKYIIHGKPLHNHDIVSVHVNHFACMTICDTLMRLYVC